MTRPRCESKRPTTSGRHVEEAPTAAIAADVTASMTGLGTHAASFRFGNVLISRGPFFPTLVWQIASGHTVRAI